MGLHKDMTEGNRVEDVQIKILTCFQSVCHLETMATIAAERTKCQQKIAIVKTENGALLVHVYVVRVQPMYD